MKRALPSTSVDGVPATFQVGEHAVVVQRHQHRWAVSVDTAPVAATFDTQAEAWEAGVREAARLDMLRGG
jgi:hypothetical protein